MKRRDDPATLELDHILGDPAASQPLKAVLRDWASRDPVDAATDAAVLSHVLGRRADGLHGDI